MYFLKSLLKISINEILTTIDIYVKCVIFEILIKSHT